MLFVEQQPGNSTLIILAKRNPSVVLDWWRHLSTPLALQTLSPMPVAMQDVGWAKPKAALSEENVCPGADGSGEAEGRHILCFSPK